MRRIVGVLKADLDNGEGFFKWGPLLDECSPILRADVLKDIKHEIDTAYEQAVRDLTPKSLRETEH
jgi:hypothetical protein